MRNVLALAGAAIFVAFMFYAPALAALNIALVAAMLATAFIPELTAGFRAVRDAIRAPAARIVARLAAVAALGSAVIAGGVSLAYAGPLMREPGDVVYLPSLAIRADGRLALLEGVTIAEAARAYAGPPTYWRSICGGTLRGWYRPIDWQGVDAVGRPLWRATIGDHGAVALSGLGAAEADPLRAFLEELAPIVACGE